MSPEQNPISIMKFGGAAVRSPACFSRNAQLIAERLKTTRRVVAVVSAMGKTTDELLHLAHEVNPKPPAREIDLLISTGERVSCSLLAMALHAIGLQAESYTGSQTGIITTPTHSNARILDVRPFRVKEALERVPVAIVAGFQGVSETKEVTTLGRGGTDTTAVALAVALRAPEVEFFKEVDGVYDADPLQHPGAKHHEKLSFSEMRNICLAGSGVLHDRAVDLAEKNDIQLWVRSFKEPLGSPRGTRIGTSFDQTKATAPGSVPVYEG